MSLKGKTLSHWFQKPHITHPCYDVMDLDVVKKFLDGTPSTRTMRYMVKSVQLNKYSSCVSKKTVLQTIKNGHKDIELWCYVNPLKDETRLNQYGCYNTDWVAFGSTQSFVLDFDDLAGVASCEDLVSAMVARNVPIPYIIVQTGPNNFHAVYYGTRGQWSERKRLWLAAKWAQVPAPKTSYDRNFSTALKLSGIDPDYFAQGYQKHKVRVPGTINTKHIINGVYWRCVSWSNTSYDAADEQYYKEIAQPRPNYIPTEAVVSIASKEPVTRSYDPEMYRDVVDAAVNDALGVGFQSIKIDNIVDMIINNLGWLMKDEYRIHQTSWADQWGCTQYDVSRAIKRLKGCGVLKPVNDSYKINGWSKTYGAGDALREAVGWSGRALQQPEWVRWDDGTSNTRMLYDIRYFASIGLPKEEILIRLHERQAHRPKRKLRTTKEFSRALDKHLAYVKENAGRKIEQEADCWGKYV